MATSTIPSFEIAVINLDAGLQYESLTFGWMKSFEEKLKHVVEAAKPGLAPRLHDSLP